MAMRKKLSSNRAKGLVERMRLSPNVALSHAEHRLLATSCMRLLTLRFSVRHGDVDPIRMIGLPFFCHRPLVFALTALKLRWVSARTLLIQHATETSQLKQI